MPDSPSRTKQGDSLLHYLCCNCGTITLATDWSYLQYDVDRDDGTLRPSEQGESDPVCRCPMCNYDHRDDYGPGMYDGTKEVCERARHGEIAEFGADAWANLEAQGNPVADRA